MPQTVEEAEAWNEDYSIPCLARRPPRPENINDVDALSKTPADLVIELN